MFVLFFIKGQGGMDYWDGEIVDEVVKNDMVIGLIVVLNYYYLYVIGYFYFYDGCFLYWIVKLIVFMVEELCIMFQGYGVFLFEVQ